MSYSSEMKAEERAVSQAQRSPRPVGEVVTEDDLRLWKERKIEMEVEDSNEIEWCDMNRMLDWTLKGGMKL